jgi:hypothetical protein
MDKREEEVQSLLEGLEEHFPGADDDDEFSGKVSSMVDDAARDDDECSKKSGWKKKKSKKEMRELRRLEKEEAMHADFVDEDDTLENGASRAADEADRAARAELDRIHDAKQDATTFRKLAKLTKRPASPSLTGLSESFRRRVEEKSASRKVVDTPRVTTSSIERMKAMMKKRNPNPPPVVKATIVIDDDASPSASTITVTDRRKGRPTSKRKAAKDAMQTGEWKKEAPNEEDDKGADDWGDETDDEEGEPEQPPAKKPKRRIKKVEVEEEEKEATPNGKAEVEESDDDESGDDDDDDDDDDGGDDDDDDSGDDDEEQLQNPLPTTFDEEYGILDEAAMKEALSVLKSDTEVIRKSCPNETGTIAWPDDIFPTTIDKTIDMDKVIDKMMAIQAFDIKVDYGNGSFGKTNKVAILREVTIGSQTGFVCDAPSQEAIDKLLPNPKTRSEAVAFLRQLSVDQILTIRRPGRALTNKKHVAGAFISVIMCSGDGDYLRGIVPQNDGCLAHWLTAVIWGNMSLEWQAAQCMDDDAKVTAFAARMGREPAVYPWRMVVEHRNLGVSDDPYEDPSISDTPFRTPICLIIAQAYYAKRHGWLKAIRDETKRQSKKKKPVPAKASKKRSSSGADAPPKKKAKNASTTPVVSPSSPSTEACPDSKEWINAVSVIFASKFKTALKLLKEDDDRTTADKLVATMRTCVGNVMEHRGKMSSAKGKKVARVVIDSVCTYSPVAILCMVFPAMFDNVQSKLRDLEHELSVHEKANEASEDEDLNDLDLSGLV